MFVGGRVPARGRPSLEFQSIRDHAALIGSHHLPDLFSELPSFSFAVEGREETFCPHWIEYFRWPASFRSMPRYSS